LRSRDESGEAPFTHSRAEAGKVFFRAVNGSRVGEGPFSGSRLESSRGRSLFGSEWQSSRGRSLFGQSSGVRERSLFRAVEWSQGRSLFGRPSHTTRHPMWSLLFLAVLGRPADLGYAKLLKVSCDRIGGNEYLSKLLCKFPCFLASSRQWRAWHVRACRMWHGPWPGRQTGGLSPSTVGGPVTFLRPEQRQNAFGLSPVGSRVTTSI
jgi:hypothetical protein